MLALTYAKLDASAIKDLRKPLPDYIYSTKDFPMKWKIIADKDEETCSLESNEDVHATGGFIDPDYTLSKFMYNAQTCHN